MTNPKELHLQQLIEACEELNIPSDAQKTLKNLALAMKKDDAIYLLSLVHDYIPEELRQRIAREYTY